MYPSTWYPLPSQGQVISCRPRPRTHNAFNIRNCKCLDKLQSTVECMNMHHHHHCGKSPLPRSDHREGGWKVEELLHERALWKTSSVSVGKYSNCYAVEWRKEMEDSNLHANLMTTVPRHATSVGIGPSHGTWVRRRAGGGTLCAVPNWTWGNNMGLLVRTVGLASKAEYERFSCLSES